VAPGRETFRGTPDDWRRAVTAIERSLDKLTEVPVSDLAAWRGASRETAGVFAAWSRRFEGDSPGPLASAADALARSAQSRPDDSEPSRGAAASFRGVTAIVAQSQLSNNSPPAWAMLIHQLSRTLRTIGDAHLARAEMETAKSLGADLAGELAVLQDRFKTSSSQELLPKEPIAVDRSAPSLYKVPEHHAARHRRGGPSNNRGFGR
jgi:hypothetical protein